MRIPSLVAGPFRASTRFHARLYRWLGGKGFLNRNTLVLTTTGRKTERAIAIPLYYVAEGERLYVVASFGGSDVAPHWYQNLLVHPEVGVELKSGGGGRYRARSLTAEEARSIWPKLLTLYPTYATYQRWTTRQIPVVELTPLGG